MKNYRLEKTESKIKECIEHLEFLKKAFNFDKDISAYFLERKIDKPSHKADDVIDFHLLFVITELEIHLCIKNYYNSKSSIEKKYCLKSGFLIIYEFFNSLNKKKNRITQLCENDENLRHNYEMITVTLRNFRKEIKLNSRIKEIRNKTAGHIHDDMQEFLGIVHSIDDKNDVIILYQLVIILNDFNNFLLKYIVGK